MSVKRGYIKQILIGLDQLFNAILFGWADETLSSRAWRQRHKPKWKFMVKLIDSIFFWQNNHCKMSFESERDRRHFPPALREDNGN